MSGNTPWLRSAAGGAGAAGLVMVLGSRGLSGMDYAQQAGAGAVACAVSDWHRANYGDGSMASMAVSVAIGAGTFAAVNKFALGAQDSWTTLGVSGAVIEVVASMIENPLGNALGL